MKKNLVDSERKQDWEWDRRFISNVYKKGENNLVDKFFTKKINKSFQDAALWVNYNEGAYKLYCRKNGINYESPAKGEEFLLTNKSWRKNVNQSAGAVKHPTPARF